MRLLLWSLFDVVFELLAFCHSTISWLLRETDSKYNVSCGFAKSMSNIAGVRCEVPFPERFIFMILAAALLARALLTIVSCGVLSQGKSGCLLRSAEPLAIAPSSFSHRMMEWRVDLKRIVIQNYTC